MAGCLSLVFYLFAVVATLVLSVLFISKKSQGDRKTSQSRKQRPTTRAHGAHHRLVNTPRRTSSTRTPSRIGPSTSPSNVRTCRYPGCKEDVDFDLNTGEEFLHCSDHRRGHSSRSSSHNTTLTMDSLPASWNSGHTSRHQHTYTWPSIATPQLRDPFYSRSSSPAATGKSQSLSPPSVTLPADHLLCKLPGCNRRRFREPDGKTHEFCGRTYAQEYAKLHQSSSGHADSGNPCSLPGCTRHKYVDPANGRVHDYCSRTHAHEAQKRGIVPKSCSLVLVDKWSEEFNTVKKLFQDKWALKKGSCPDISFVFAVRNSQLLMRWNRYRKTLPGDVQHVEKYYHGTKLMCDITKQRTLCSDKDCGVCGISNTGTDRRYIRKNISFQRFGHGFYFAPNSSKCHDYTQGVAQYMYRAMLQCDVLPGKKHTLTRGDVKLTGPSGGCHSVYGQEGEHLNYPELVVYNTDCVMPRYIIVYQKDGVHKIAK